jgi:hypothetical protein
MAAPRENPGRANPRAKGDDPEVEESRRNLGVACASADVDRLRAQRDRDRRVRDLDGLRFAVDAEGAGWTRHVQSVQGIGSGGRSRSNVVSAVALNVETSSGGSL